TRRVSRSFSTSGRILGLLLFLVLGGDQSASRSARRSEYSNVAKQTKVILTSQDFDRLEALLASLPANAFPGKTALQAELQRAERVDPKEAPPDVVPMNSTVRLRLVESGQDVEHTLCYPKHVQEQPARTA